MNDLEYYKGVDELLDILLTFVPPARLSVTVNSLNNVLIETSKRKTRSEEDVLCGKTI